MKQILTVLLFMASSFFSTASKTDSGCLRMDILFLIDYSHSVSNHEYFISNAFEAFINRFNLSDNGIKIGGYYFNNNAFLISSLTSNKIDLIKGVEYIRNNKAEGGTDLFDGLKKSQEEFEINGRDNTPKLLILISDGKPDKSTEPICRSQVTSIKTTFPELKIISIFVGNNGIGLPFLNQISDIYLSTNYMLLVNELEMLDICL